MRGLYRSGVWLTQRQALQFGSARMQFLSAVWKVILDGVAAEAGPLAFAAKAPLFHHTMLELLISSKKLTWTISPLVYSVRMQEDYIGKPFCVSPRVSAKMHSLRAPQ